MDLWDKHWSAYADAATQNPAQTYRRRLVLDLLGLDEAPAPVRLLDVGCGQGDLSREIAERYPHVEIAGIDFSAEGIRIAAAKVPKGRFLQGDLSRPIEIPPELHGWATHATCVEVLEHVDDPVAVLSNVRPLLVPGCRLVTTVPGGPMSAFDQHIGHRRHYTPEALSDVIRRANLDVELVRAAGFPFFNLYRLVTVARGRALIEDADGGETGQLALPIRIAMRGFDWLFRWNRPDTRHGWQMIARAVNPR